MKNKFNLSLVLRVALLTIAGLVLFYPTGIKLFVTSKGKTTKHIYIGKPGPWNYFVYTPKGYSLTSKVPLVVVIHGCTETAASIAADSKFNDLADKEKFIVVYPEQSLLSNIIMCWNWYLPAHQDRGSGEPAIVAGIVKAVQKNIFWNIDDDRIYVAGLSTGAALAVIMGATYPDIFAAVGVGSGFQYKSATNYTESKRQNFGPGPDPINQGHIAHQAMGPYARRVPTIIFHGTADIVVPFIHGSEIVTSMAVANSLADPSFNSTDFLAPDSTVNGTAPGPRGHNYTAMSWNDNKGKTVVHFYQVHTMNHAWSGGAPPLINGADIYTDPRGPCFTDIAYKFFSDNPMNAGAEYADAETQLVFDY